MSSALKSSRNLLGLLGLIVCLGGAAPVNAQTGIFSDSNQIADDLNDLDQNNANYFIMPYLMSYMYDQCGDNELGAVYRKALKDKVVECRLSEKALAIFNQQSEQNEKAILPQLDDYHRVYGDHPDTINNGETKCSIALNKPETIDLKTKIKDYMAGNLSLSSALPMSCPHGDPTLTP